MNTLDARGLSCPEPVILTMNAMKKGGSKPIKVTVSNTVARDNICSLAKKRKRIKELGFLRETRKGRQRFYSLDLGRMG